MQKRSTAGMLAAAQIWFGGVDPVVQADRHTDQPADYMQMFTPDAPWQQGEAGVTVFKISTQLVNRGTDEQIHAVLDGVRRRHLMLGMAISPLQESARCGHAIEGYSATPTLGHVVARLARLGYTLDYAAMDEPLWFGHEMTDGSRLKPGSVFCNDSIDMVARQAAAAASVIHAVFPNAKIGDAEPINGHLVELGQLVEDIATFDQRFAAYGGRPLAFVHCDVSWSFPWQAAIAPLAQRLRAQGTRFGVFVDGQPRDPGGAAWNQAALRHLDAFEQALGSEPDDIVVQSWQPLPETMLPETDPAALTYLLKAVVSTRR